MFERFTDPSRRVVVAAQEHARSLGHNYIGTEHLLLALITNTGSIADSILDAAGVSHDRVRRDLEERIGSGGSEPVGHIPFTPRAKQALEQALRAALQARVPDIRSSHLLLGVLHDRAAVACASLQALGVDLDQLTAACEARASEPEAGAGFFRRDLSTAPFCPACKQPLRDNLSHQDLEVDSITGRNVTLSVVFCGRCGTLIETSLHEQPGS